MDKTRESLIYKLTSPSNKSYIGQTKQGLHKRVTQHWYNSSTESSKNGCWALYAAIYLNPNIKDWKVEILIKCSIDDLDREEIKFIKEYNTLYPFGYNLTMGGKNFSGNLSDASKVKKSRNQCKYKDKYDHVYGVRTTSKNDKKRGFRVFTDDGKYRSFTFSSWKNEVDYLYKMKQMYERAVKYSDEAKHTKKYKPPLTHYIDDTEVPLGIDKAKNTGFSFKLGVFKAFTSKKNHVLFNLLLTIQHYLINIDYDSFAQDSLDALKYEKASELYDLYKLQLEEQSSTSLRELVL